MSFSKLHKICQNNLTREKLGEGFAALVLGTYIIKKCGLTPQNILKKFFPTNQLQNSKFEVVVKGKKDETKRTKKEKVVNKAFLKQLMHLLKIVFPSIRSRQFLLLVTQTLVLILRTWLSVVVAKMDGYVVKSIVQKAPLNFASSLFWWLAIAVPATFVNSFIRFLESKIALSIRTKLVSHAYQLYFKNQTFYRVSNLDNRLVSVDHNLTEDLTCFANSLSHLYSHLSKPILDILVVWFSLYFTAKSIGASMKPSTTIGAGVLVVTATILRKISPNFGKLISDEAEKKGLLRAAHSRIINNAEEIAFYSGHKTEQAQLMSSYNDLCKKSNTLYWKKLWYVHMEQFLMKYLWSASGLVMISLPILSVELGYNKEGNAFSQDSHEKKDNGISLRTQIFTTSRSLLLSLADAFERLMSSYKEITELVGYTERVNIMFEVFKDVADKKYSSFSDDALLLNDDDDINGELEEDVFKKTDDHKTDNHHSKSHHHRHHHHHDYNHHDEVIRYRRGVVLESLHDISLDSVAIVTPTNHVVVKKLSFKLEKGMDLLISGPNGCGKSSLFRVLSGLWSVAEGVVRKPPSSTIFYIPQKPYMCVGNLRQQVIYPDDEVNMKAKRISDTELMSIMNTVGLGPLFKKNLTWDSICDWKSVLSGGEKQKIGMARIFYHRPQYALLDECTSAISIDYEASIYEELKLHNITVLSISHRPSLWKFHSHLLQFNGDGGWKFEELNQDSMMSLKEEKNQLEMQLVARPDVEKRLKEVCRLLGEDSEILHRLEDSQSESSSSDVALLY